MSNIVIGIHGLSNKPAEEQLKIWWKQAILEGLKRNHSLTPSFSFDLVYWANVRNKKPIARHDLDEPHVAAEGYGPLPRSDQEETNRIRVTASETVGSFLDKEKLSGLDKPVEIAIGVSLKDLAEYYRKLYVVKVFWTRGCLN